MLITSTQKVEHYEIATYGTRCTWAERLGLESGTVEFLQQEKETDTKLTKLTQHANRQP